MASSDLGDLGSKESDPVPYTWNFIDNLSGLAIWVALVGAFVLFKENRSGKALLILVPLLVVNLLWLGSEKIPGMQSGSAVIFDVMFNSFTIGMAAVWLVSHKFAGRNRLGVFFWSLVIMLLTFFVAMIAFKGLDFDEEVLQIGVLYCVTTVAALLALVMAGCCCRAGYTSLKFMLWLALWCICLGVASMAAFFAFAVVMIMASGGSISITSEILEVLAVGLILGGVLYVLLLPYMVFVMANGLFRRRFYGCFRLKGMLAPAVVETEDFSDERPTDLI